MRSGYLKGTAVSWVIDWVFLIFLNAADCELLLHMFHLPPTVISIAVVMIMRVYAMWNRSKWILYLLLFIYVPQVVITFVFAGVYGTSKYLTGMSQIFLTCHSTLTQVALHFLLPFSPVTTVQIMDFTVCNPSWSNTPFVIEVFNEMPRFVLGAMLFILAVTQTLKQSLTMYKATKRWQPNRYMERLAKDGVIYFLVYVSVSTLSCFHLSPSRSPTHLAVEHCRLTLAC